MTESGLNTGYDSLGRYPFWCNGTSVSVRKIVIEFLFRLESEKKYSLASSGLLFVVFFFGVL